MGQANRDRGESRDSSPPTPPDVRVRIRRFGGLSRPRHRDGSLPDASRRAAKTIVQVGDLSMRERWPLSICARPTRERTKWPLYLINFENVSKRSGQTPRVHHTAGPRGRFRPTVHEVTSGGKAALSAIITKGKGGGNERRFPMER